jgi:hypothetical protein
MKYQIECLVIIKGDDRLELEAIQEVLLAKVTDLANAEGVECNVVFQPISEVADEDA